MPPHRFTSPACLIPLFTKLVPSPRIGQRSARIMPSLCRRRHYPTIQRKQRVGVARQYEECCHQALEAEKRSNPDWAGRREQRASVEVNVPFSQTRRNLSGTTPPMVSSTPERAGTISSPPVTASSPAIGGFTVPGLECSGGSCATP